jgi:hypothetical protein
MIIIIVIAIFPRIIINTAISGRQADGDCGDRATAVVVI